MPLPAALLNKLKKRGIVKEDGQSQSEGEPKVKKLLEENKIPEEECNNKKKQYPPFAECCPNKYNPYHICEEFCHINWTPKFNRYQLQMEYLEAKHHLLLTYPLAPGWREMFDEGSGQHYFWYPPSGLVSWLPPSHPEAKVTLPCYKHARNNFRLACLESTQLENNESSRTKLKLASTIDNADVEDEDDVE
uniref:WW domain-containing protein n=1 Tax=Parastrongyloides trichosuri TaxID=131310 RepID=A0A0N4ZH37_PARTI